MKINLIKISGSLIPFTNEDRELISGLKPNQVLECSFVRKRNIKFHRKFYALINHAYDMFEPQDVEINGRSVAGCKDFDEFRKWLIVKAGYYEVVGYPDGGVRLRAKSISFAKMEEEEFAKLYSNCIDIILRYVCVRYSKEDLENTINQVMSFT